VIASKQRTAFALLDDIEISLRGIGIDGEQPDHPEFPFAIPTLNIQVIVSIATNFSFLFAQHDVLYVQ
jgi:hypothetical protein